MRAGGDCATSARQSVRPVIRVGRTVASVSLHSPRNVRLGLYVCSGKKLWAGAGGTGATFIRSQCGSPGDGGFQVATEAQIRDYAHTLWEKAGRPEGRDLEFWHAAEVELNAESESPDAPTTSDQPNARSVPG